MKIIAVLIVFLFLGQSMAKDFPGDSIFQLNSSWITHQGKNIKLKDLGGQAAYVGLIFTSCKGVCPLIISDLKHLSGKLSKDSQKKVKFILVSIDPEYDTPEVLAAYKKKMKLDDRWTLLNGKEFDVKELAVALEFQYKEHPSEKFTHSTGFYLINGQGQVVVKQSERLRNSDNFVKKSKELFK